MGYGAFLTGAALWSRGIKKDDDTTMSSGWPSYRKSGGSVLPGGI